MVERGSNAFTITENEENCFRIVKFRVANGIIRLSGLSVSIPQEFLQQNMNLCCISGSTECAGGGFIQNWTYEMEFVLSVSPESLMNCKGHI